MDHLSLRGYRPEIDGLRAIAVLGVILFHANLGFPGGYVGVDVFFVISGFLITGLVLREVEENKFSLGNFWARRMGRILPAMTATILVTLVLGYFVLLPMELAKLSKLAFAQGISLANVLLWKTDGYFETSSHDNPLLHMWSLSLEEQYYVFLPLFLLGLRRFSRRVIAGILTIGAMASFALCVYASSQAPTANFYLLPTRAWELLIGSLLAFVRLPHQFPLLSSRIRSFGSEIGSAIGLLGILLPMFFYHERIAFPGWSALPPVLGTAAFIFANSTGQTSSGYLLSRRFFVSIGLVSYSLYLWHWPILVYARQLSDRPANADKLAPLLLMAVVSYGSYRLIEKPVRQWARHLPARKVVAGGLTTIAALLGVSWGIYQADGLRQWHPQKIVQSLDFIENTEGTFQDDYARESIKDLSSLPTIGSTRKDIYPTFIVWGDSHTGTICRLLDELAKNRDMKGAVAYKSGTPPAIQPWFLELGGGLNRKQKQEWNDNVLKKVLEDERVQDVLLHARWSQYIIGAMPLKENESSDLPRFENHIQEFVNLLRQSGKRVWILGPVPEQPFHVQRALFLSSRYETLLSPPRGITAPEFLARSKQVAKALEAVDNDGVFYFDTSVPFFEGEFCRIVDDGHPLYRDDNHLTYHGTCVLMKPLLARILDSIQREQLSDALGHK